MLKQISDAFDRAVAASAQLLAKDGNQAGHNERVGAIEALLYGPGLDLGQAAPRGPARHGDPDLSFRPPPPPRDFVSTPTLAFLRQQKLI